MRKTKEEIKELEKLRGVDRSWSFSRVDTFKTSPYEYFLKYVRKIEEDRTDCIYASIGSLAHDILDNFYENKIGYSDMINNFIEGWVVNREICRLKFDRNDNTKDESISEKYLTDLTHFFKNHKPIKIVGDIQLEPFVEIKVKNNLFFGYIDALFKDESDIYNIIDFKTSSMYKGDSLEAHSGQLILYALGLSQKGVPLDRIRCSFNFLKYVTIEYEQKNGEIKKRDIQRSKIGDSLKSNAKVWLKYHGYEPEPYLEKMVQTNSLDYLPKEVKERYSIADCYVEVEITKKNINKWIEHLDSVIQDIKVREQDYFNTNNDRVFFDSEESVKKESFYFATLCGYSANLHQPYKLYLEKLEKEKNNTVFGEPIKTKVSADDLAWLNAL